MARRVKPKPITCSALPPGDEQQLCLEVKNSLSGVTPASSRSSYIGMLQKCIALPSDRDRKGCFNDVRDVATARKEICSDRAFKTKCKSGKAAARKEVGDAISSKVPQPTTRLKSLLTGAADAYVPPPSPPPPTPLSVNGTTLGVTALVPAEWLVRTPATYGGWGSGLKLRLDMKPEGADKTYHAQLQFDVAHTTGGPYFKDDTTEAKSWKVVGGLGSTSLVKGWDKAAFYSSSTQLIGLGEQVTGPLSAMTFVTGSESDFGLNWHAAKNWDFRLNLGLQTFAQTSRGDSRLNGLTIAPFLQLSGSYGDTFVRQSVDTDKALDTMGKAMTLAMPVFQFANNVNSYYALAGQQNAINEYADGLAPVSNKSTLSVIKGVSALSDTLATPSADAVHMTEGYVGGFAAIGIITSGLALGLTKGISGYASPMEIGRVGIMCAYGICTPAGRNLLSEDVLKLKTTKANSIAYATNFALHSIFTMAGFTPGMTATAAGAAKIPYELDLGRRGKLLDYRTFGIIPYEGTIAGGDDVGMGGFYTQGDMEMGVAGKPWLKTYGRMELKSKALRLDKIFALLQVQDDPPDAQTSYETWLASSFGIMLAPQLHENVRLAARAGLRMTAMYGNPDGHVSAPGFELGLDGNFGTKKAGVTLGVTLTGQCAFPNADCKLLLSGGAGIYF